jgi:hypothetical protein
MYSPEHGTIVTIESKTECTLNTTQLEHVVVEYRVMALKYAT